MQRSMGLFSAACHDFDLVIKTEKMVVVHQPPPDVAYVAPQINVNGALLQVVDNFPYLAVTSPAAPTSITKSPAGFRKPVKPSVAFKAQFGIFINTEAEVAGSHPRHGRTGADGNPQNLRYAETTTTTLERLRRTDGGREAIQTTLLRTCPHTASNVFTMSTDIPGANWACWTPPDQLQYLDCTNRCLSVYSASCVSTRAESIAAPTPLAYPAHPPYLAKPTPHRPARPTRPPPTSLESTPTLPT
ncbi:hypothetical protein SprV_0301095300 [Sparganum proliferum]